MTTNTRAATYCRYSSANQKASSLEDQQRNCQRRIDAEGWNLVAQFADAEISGSDANRPQYKALQQAAKRHEFDVLLVDDLSRLTRDSMEQERVIRSLEFGGVRIVATSDGYDSTSKTRKLHRAFKGVMNEVFLDDLAQRVHRGQEGKAIKGYWNGGRPYGFRLVSDTSTNRHGEQVKVGTVLKVHEVQGPIVREMFERAAVGESCGAIARELNARAVPSPGSTWNRKSRRCEGWLGSAVRVILLNPLYKGDQRWNRSQFVRDPDTNKHLRRARPEGSWQITHHEHLRIVSDEVFAAAQRSPSAVGAAKAACTTRGKAKYVLSGLLVCDTCAANYVIADARSYGCSGYLNGGKHVCANDERIRIDAIEAAILQPVKDGLRDPERVKRMAAFMQAEFAMRIAAASTRSSELPKELRDLDARIERLRVRLRDGDEDLTAAQVKVVLDAAIAQRQELAQARPEARASARILSMLPRAADAYVRQIDAGVGGDTRAVQKARHVLKELVGKVKLIPGKKGELFASYRLNPHAVLKAAGFAVRSASYDGRGERI